MNTRVFVGVKSIRPLALLVMNPKSSLQSVVETVRRLHCDSVPKHENSCLCVCGDCSYFGAWPVCVNYYTCASIVFVCVLITVHVHLLCLCVGMSCGWGRVG